MLYTTAFEKGYHQAQKDCLSSKEKSDNRHKDIGYIEGYEIGWRDADWRCLKSQNV